MSKIIEIAISGGKYKFKHNSIRAMFRYEEMTGKSSSAVETLEDNTTMIYCVLEACNKDSFELSFDEFLDLIEDGNDNIYGQISKFSTKK